MGIIEEMFEEFISQADPQLFRSAENKDMIKALYYTSLGHFLMTKTDFILKDNGGKKLIQHITMCEEIKDFMLALRDKMEKHQPQRPH